jgi:hypothetical protein
MDERCRLKRVAGPFALHINAGHPAQFVVDDRNQPIGSLPVATAQLSQQNRDLPRRRSHPSPPRPKSRMSRAPVHPAVLFTTSSKSRSKKDSNQINNLVINRKGVVNYLDSSRVNHLDTDPVTAAKDIDKSRALWFGCGFAIGQPGVSQE